MYVQLLILQKVVLLFPLLIAARNSVHLYNLHVHV